MNKSKLILITGASGFIGRHVVRKFLAEGEGDRIRILLRNPNNNLFKDISGIDVIPGRLSDRAQITKALQDVDTVIHLASKNIDKEGTGFVKTNVDGTRTLCELSVTTGVNRFIYLSSVGVYGHKVHRNASETTPVAPDTEFSRSKAAAEAIILEHVRKENFTGVILRPRFVYGEGDRSFLPRMVKAAEQYKFLLDGGRAKISLILVDNLAEVIFRFATREIPKTELPIYHVTDGVPISYRDIIFSISQAYGFKPPRISLPFQLLYWPIRLNEWLRGIDPETTHSSLSSIRLKLVANDNYFSNKKLLKIFPDLELLTFQETFKWLIPILNSGQIYNQS